MKHILLIALLISLSSTPGFAEKIRVGSWILNSTDDDDPLCSLTLNTWKYRIYIVFYDGDYDFEVDFKALSFSSRNDWGYLGSGRIFRFESDTGLYADIPVSDEWYKDLQISADDGHYEAPRPLIFRAMDIIAAGSELVVIREIIEETRTGKYQRVNKEILRVSYSGGSQAIDAFKNCAALAR